jgi:hypothetical protein
MRERGLRSHTEPLICRLRREVQGLTMPATGCNVVPMMVSPGSQPARGRLERKAMRRGPSLAT